MQNRKTVQLRHKKRSRLLKYKRDLKKQRLSIIKRWGPGITLQKIDNVINLVKARLCELKLKKIS